MSKEYLSAESVALMLDTSKSTVLRLVETGVLPQGIKIGGLKRWHADSIRKAVARHLETASAKSVLDDPDKIIQGFQNGKNRQARPGRRDR